MNITYEEIDKTLSDTPSFHLQEMQKGFEGRKIEWTLYFCGMSQKVGNVWQVRSGIESNNWIYFDLDLDEHPEFKRFSRGEVFEVKGVIKKIEWVSIYLHIVSVAIPEQLEDKKIKPIEELKSVIPLIGSTFTNSKVHFGQGDLIVENKTQDSGMNLWSKYWWYLIIPTIVIILGYVITEGKTPAVFSSTKIKKEDLITVEEKKAKPIKDNLRPLQILETGKKISELPENVYFYSTPYDVYYEIQDSKKDFIAVTNQYSKDYSFEIQKIDNRYYLIGFISNENYSKIGSVSSDHSLHLVLFSYSWAEFNHPIAIPFDKIYNIEPRKINLDEMHDTTVFDIGFTEVKDNPFFHNKTL